jgi:hypothetical protein
MIQNHLLPLPEGLPTFQSALQSLGRVPEILYRGLEYGASKTSEFRQREFPRKRLDACLSASIFRAHGIEYLRREGIDAQPDGFKWMFNNLPFLGISFYYNQMHVRILKGPDGILPGCGRSRRKHRFYDQLPSNYLLGNVPMRSTANLIVLWDFNGDYALARLWLTLPANGGQRPQDVSAFWCNSLDHPAEMTGPVAVTPTPPSDSGDDGMSQLIRPKVEIDEKKKSKG